MTLARFTLGQLVAVAVALLLLIAADRLVVEVWPAPPRAPEKVQIHSEHVGNWESPAAAMMIRGVLATRRPPMPVLLFGSSELTSHNGYEPYRFFAEHFGRDVIAFGTGGAQSLTILTTLLQHERLLGPQTRIVVMLSAWWFLNPGTDANAFRHFTQPTALREILEDPGVSREFTAPITTFMREKMYHINPPTPEMLLFRFPWLGPWGGLEFVEFTRDVFPAFVRTHSRIYQDYLRRDFVLEPSAPPAPPANPFDWDGELNRLRHEYDEHARSNQLGFDDEHWPAYQKTVPRELQAPVAGMTELHDLQALTAFLHSKQVPALFILQPLNQFAYTHLERFDELRREIAANMHENEMDFVDVMGVPYEREMLIDLAHPGAYGWLKNDRLIYKWLERHP